MTRTSIRPLTFPEVEQLVNWAALEGWNPGVHDAANFWAADPEGFLGLEVDGELAGGGSVVRHNPHFGFMGLFILRPEFRGQGLGEQLWYARRDHLLARLTPLPETTSGTIGLDAVTNMIPFYAKGGFVPQYRHCRYEAQAHSLPVVAKASEIVELDSIPRERIEVLDARCFPGARPNFLNRWLTQPGIVSLAWQEGKNLRGYSLLRRCRVGWKLAPLYAETPEIARALLLTSFQHTEGQSLLMDVPENNQAAIELCQSLGMTQIFECTRMYFGPIPTLAHEQIFGITSLELG
ncbi:GCN5-related N-acetyltransferase [Planctopirus limnophila DSM 3776]|uniref:GCN5-related N-acetyltransferase n=1 Tax=Planctopirus limnophila (strain ATCC 43296 / DSM 3776 / IFAM 1008 / Mu 290) TaxID=521674 RepID=D5STQ5_PLAL2|nr:GNAT family N-acetyltransferase [Planctopirus limnophila]ADG69084.1 GCN5-related N-acetyltransferase [Planctopirus limnophila DSM 3776]